MSQSIISNENLPHTATIYKRKFVSTAQFGTKQTLEEDQTGVKCWVQLAKMGEIVNAQKLEKTVTHKIYFSVEPGLEEGDAVEITASKTDDQTMVGLAFEYRVKADASAGLGLWFKHMFEEFQLPHEGAEQ